MSTASVRLRCLHFARILEEDFNFKSYFYNETLSIEKSLVPGDTLIIVKFLDFRINKLVLKSYSLGVPVLLDVCDNIIDHYYKQNEYSYHLNNLLSLSKFISKILVPNNSLKEIFLKALDNHSYKPDIFILPDPAESENDVYLTSKYLITRIKSLANNFLNFDQEKISYKKILGSNRKDKILWFGNSYSPTSNMGFLSLIPHLKTLKKMQRQKNFILTICSNLKADISFLDNYDINFELVDWSLNNIFYQLSTSSCSLITTGNDERCITKSNNRILKSFRNGCPPIVINCYNDGEVKGYATTGLKKGVQNFIQSENRNLNIKENIDKAKLVLERFDSKNIAKSYANIIINSHLLSKIYDLNLIGESEINCNISIICDHIPVNDLRTIIKRFDEKENEYSLKFLFYEYDLKLLEFFIEFQIIPYNCGIIEKNSSKAEMTKFLTNMSQILKEDKFIIISNKKNKNNLMQFLENSKSNLIYKYKKYTDFLLEKEYIKKDEFLINKQNYIPTNIPGKSLPINIFENKKLKLDILFVTTLQTKNWILDGIAKEIGSRGENLNWSVFYYSKETFNGLPKTKSIFFMHQSILDLFIAKDLINLDSIKVMCWYTHPNPLHEKPNIISRYIDNFNKIHKVVFACSRYKKLWIKRGLVEAKTICIIGGADENIFSSQNRNKSNYIGLCSSYYERKNPKLLYDIVKNMVNYKFILLGKDWENFSLFDDLLINGNVQYIQAKYHEYPKYYRKMKVFLSLSFLEGGPIPLLEAMMSNCFPVITDVGFCSDVVINGKNGFLFDPYNYKLEEVISLIERAFMMDDINIRDTVMEYTWDCFSKNVLKELEK